MPIQVLSLQLHFLQKWDNIQLLYSNYNILIKNGFIDSKSEDDKIIYTWWDQRAKKIINPKNNKGVSQGAKIKFKPVKAFMVGIAKAVKIKDIKKAKKNRRRIKYADYLLKNLRMTFCELN